MSHPELTIHTDLGPLKLPAGSTLADAVERVLAGTDRDPASVATAVNGGFVARGARAQHVLADGDAVLCFSPITGG
ncbi:MoaD/ThiS family protein [uncultured Aquabacterium sp.]|jgi:sulfur carrier protein|uniref:sulfur carrier protein ThiS n=1 Tax=uncultured Aquabacterium sp. TaxID=158753 RepID=UPI0026068129|nr:MoaD/ThiS family protein [uncultured Aquabacterium sp.]